MYVYRESNKEKKLKMDKKNLRTSIRKWKSNR